MKMEIKILVPENRKSDLDNFIKDCENKGFELQNRGGGHMPNFSGYYATLKGSRWEPNPTAQLQADKAELLEALAYAKRHCKKPAPVLFDKIESLIQKHKK